MLTLLRLRCLRLNPSTLIARNCQFDFGRIASRFDTGRLSLFTRLRSHFFSMSSKHLCSVRDSSNDDRFRLKDAFFQSFRQGCVVNSGDDDVFAPSPSEVPPSDDFVVAPVKVTVYLKTFRLFLDARRFAATH